MAKVVPIVMEASDYQPMEGICKAINSAYQQAGIEFTRPESGIYS